MTNLDISPVHTDPELDDSHNRMAHIVLEGFTIENSGDYLSMGPTVVESMVNQVPVKALCGKTFVMNHNPRNYPLCPACEEIAKSKGWAIPSG